MGIMMECRCDLCGTKMPVPDDYKDNNRPSDLRVNPVGGIFYNFEFVCDNCQFHLRREIDALRNSKIEKTEATRNQCFQSYYGQGLTNRKQFIDSVNTCRQLTGLGLKEAKDMCEKWRDDFAWDKAK